jgi:hypothetical protein
LPKRTHMRFCVHTLTHSRKHRLMGRLVAAMNEEAGAAQGTDSHVLWWVLEEVAALQPR